MKTAKTKGSAEYSFVTAYREQVDDVHHSDTAHIMARLGKLLDETIGDRSGEKMVEDLLKNIRN